MEEDEASGVLAKEVPGQVGQKRAHRVHPTDILFDALSQNSIPGIATAGFIKG
jgi:hypothetical protein